jgi:putative membrane protein
MWIHARQSSVALGTAQTAFNAGSFVLLYHNRLPAAAASLCAATIGFTLPLAHAVAQAANIVDSLIWGSIALLVRLASYLVVRALMPGMVRGIPEGKVAQGVFLGTVAIATAIINAACMAD